MSDDQDFSQLPVDEKIAHNVWKVRLDGYTTLIGQFENSRNENDACFGVLNVRSDSLKTIVLDSNVVAQETAVLLLCKYLEYGCPSSAVPRLKSSGVVSALCEKGLASSRAGTKAKSVDAILLLGEVSGSADWIVEQILPYLENRLPKLVAGCVHALHQLSVDEPMEDVSNLDSAQEFDPYDMMEPVEVLTKLPGDLHARASSTKWKDRVEVLEEVQVVLSKAPKLVADDYTDLVRLFAKCFKDANIQVVQLAANGIESLAKGLKTGFSKYKSLVLAPLIERSKEKKPAVADALANALDSIFASSSLSDVLDETIVGMKHKTPQVKISSTNYLQRCLSNTNVAPKSAQIDQIMQVGVKLLTDSQEPIRQAATVMVGTLMKITGERELKSLLENVDDNRLAKVRTVYESVSVKVTGTGSRAPTSSTSRPDSVPKTAPSQARLGSTPTLKKTAASSSIPSKRLASSPAKRPDSGAKVPVKSFTGRSLISPAANGAAAKPKSEPPSIPPQILEELRTLKEENRRLKEENDSASKVHATLVADVRRLTQEKTALTEKLEMLYRDNTNGNLMVKQKDTQIMRYTSDLENAKLKIKTLEQNIEMMKLQQSTIQTQPSQPLPRDAFTSPFASPARFSSSRLSSTELSSRVNRLSIEGGANLPNITDDQSRGKSADEPGTSDFTREPISGSTGSYSRPEVQSTGDGEENWRKATEVTAQLKARIEKMKQRNRLSSR
ncbi:hypothetical protein JCM33374_g1775 [Metschnikowia sp. JCM 33374]|nr:hypothetical protein JCM33374_g1775 [Metschnikowia sp. JCM 33374]